MDAASARVRSSRSSREVSTAAVLHESRDQQIPGERRKCSEQCQLLPEFSQTGTRALLPSAEPWARLSSSKAKAAIFTWAWAPPVAAARWGRGC